MYTEYTQTPTWVEVTFSFHYQCTDSLKAQVDSITVHAKAVKITLAANNLKIGTISPPKKVFR